MAKGVSEIRGGVNNVGSNNQIIAARVESLCLWVFFYVQGFITHEGICAEFLPRFGSEQRRDVGKGIAGAICRQMRQNKVGWAACARADLQSTQGAPCWKRLNKPIQSVLQQPVIGFSDRRLRVELLRPRQITTGEQQFQRISAASQHVSQMRAARP